MDSVAAFSWTVAIDQFGGSADAAASTAAELERRYREPHRRYHTLGHIEAVLADCARLAGELGLSVTDRAVIDLAACAHDVVYAAEPGADERASAAWAAAQLAVCGLEAEVGHPPIPPCPPRHPRRRRWRSRPAPARGT